MLDREDWLGLTLFIFIQFIGSYVPVNRKQYAEGAKLVPGSPPGWIFGPVWILLKLLRGFAGFFYWHKGPASLGSTYDWTLAIYGVNVLLDIQWMPLFFGAKRAGTALVVLVFMWLTGVATLVLFAVDGEWFPSFSLYIPYIVWISYAGYLNYAWWSKMVWQAIGGLPMPASVKSKMGPADKPKSKKGGRKKVSSSMLAEPNKRK